MRPYPSHILSFFLVYGCILRQKGTLSVHHAPVLMIHSFVPIISEAMCRIWDVSNVTEVIPGNNIVWIIVPNNIISRENLCSTDGSSSR